MIGCSIYSLGLYLLIQCVLLYIPLIVGITTCERSRSPLLTLLSYLSTPNTVLRCWQQTTFADLPSQLA